MKDREQRTNEIENEGKANLPPILSITVVRNKNKWKKVQLID